MASPSKTATPARSALKHFVQCIFCAEKFPDPQSCHIHIKQHIHKCDECLRGYIYEKDLQSHKRSACHLYCGSCEAFFPIKLDFEKHISEKHNFFCTNCGRAFTSEINFDTHQRLQNHHAQYPSRCFVCDIWYESPLMLWQHQIGSDHFDCCETKFAGITVLEEHFARAHQSMDRISATCYRCIECLQPFGTADLLTEHQKKNKHAFCCNTMFFSRSALEAHKLNAVAHRPKNPNPVLVPANKPIEWDTPFVPPPSTALSSTNIPKPQIPIQVQPKRSTYAPTLSFSPEPPKQAPLETIPEAAETPLKTPLQPTPAAPLPFRCFICANTYHTPAELKYHQWSTSHGLCCRTAFRSASALETHQSAHRHTCGVCEQAFLTREMLATHQKVEAHEAYIKATVRAAMERVAGAGGEGMAVDASAAEEDGVEPLVRILGQMAVATPSDTNAAAAESSADLLRGLVIYATPGIDETVCEVMDVDDADDTDGMSVQYQDSDASSSMAVATPSSEGEGESHTPAETDSSVVATEASDLGDAYETIYVPSLVEEETEWYEIIELSELSSE